MDAYEYFRPRLGLREKSFLGDTLASVASKAKTIATAIARGIHDMGTPSFC